MFAKKEVRNNGTCGVAGSEHVAVPVVDGLCDEWGKEGNQEVPAPVTSGSNSHSHGSVAARIQLTHNTPNDWRPGHGVSCNE